MSRPDSVNHPARILTAVLLVFALLAFFVPCAAASGSWLMFSEDQIPEEQGFLVRDEYTGTVCITFLGDCTLGGEEKVRNAYRGFARTIERNGPAYPFRNLITMTGKDDLTVANLEGVLSDRELKKVQKTYNFIGSTSYTDILTAGSVDCVSLANNHTHDYGNEGYADTKQALEDAGIAWFGTDRMAVWENGSGLMIGFLGVSGSLSGDRAKDFRNRAEALRSMGCAAIITVMHAGTEYDPKPDGYQRQIVAKAASVSSLIVGHHPHIVQGVEEHDGVPVVYSLGNCVFGGNGNPKDHDALALQAELDFEEGELTGITLHFYPISVSGEASYNDYSPVLLEGKGAERVLKKMEESTGVSPGPFSTETGAVMAFPARNQQGDKRP